MPERMAATSTGTCTTCQWPQPLSSPGHNPGCHHRPAAWVRAWGSGESWGCTSYVGSSVGTKAGSPVVGSIDGAVGWANGLAPSMAQKWVPFCILQARCGDQLRDHGGQGAKHWPPFVPWAQRGAWLGRWAGCGPGIQCPGPGPRPGGWRCALCVVAKGPQGTGHEWVQCECEGPGRTTFPPPSTTKIAHAACHDPDSTTTTTTPRPARTSALGGSAQGPLEWGSWDVNAARGRCSGLLR